MPETLHPNRYRLTIIPDLDRHQFEGRVFIDVEAPTAVTQVVLNLQDLAVWDCALEVQGCKRACNFTVVAAAEELIVHLPESRSGAFTLAISYEGRINDRMMGFYRSHYQHEGKTRTIAVTQFQESAARQALPCLDHPLYKAVFELTMIIPGHLRAIANTPVISQTVESDGRRRLVFQATPRMSTYLLFFGVGDFEFTQDDKDPRVRVVTLPGFRQTTHLGLSFGRKALQYCEVYYGSAYPLEKMDLIAIPDFAFGAMENWGAITFRENLLLHFEGLTSVEGIERICETIAHEIAHQWFGNLVTPADWKYIWLNESFATYFGYGVVAHHHPDWGTWDQFLHAQTAQAFTRDGLKSTVAIEIPGGGAVAINVSSAPIIYNKGASMLRMIEGTIGATLYQKGVRAYLSEHAYQCAESHHLWEAFEAAAAMPVTAMMQNWVSQPGHPLVVGQRRDNRLHLRQQRFTYLPDTHEQTWIIPLSVDLVMNSGRMRRQVMVLDRPEADISLPEGTLAYKLNAGQSGFFRVDYDDGDNLAALGSLIAAGSLSPVDRWGVQNDLYAMVRAGRRPLAAYLAFLDHYSHETHDLPLMSIAANLQQAFCIVHGPPRDQVIRKGHRLCRQALAGMGMQPQSGEAHTRAALRNQLLWQAVQWDLESARTFCDDQFQQLIRGETVHADIARSVLQTGACRGGAGALAWLKQRFLQSASEHERMNILTALGACQPWDRLEAALAFVLDQAPPRNRFLAIVAAATNPAAGRHLWRWYQRHISQLEAFHPLLYERVITAVTPLCGLEAPAEINTFFNEYLKRQPRLGDAVAMALEYLAINVAMRRAANP